MLKRIFGNSWLRHASTICFASGMASASLPPVFGQGHGGGHSGGHAGGHTGSQTGGMHAGGGSHYSGHSHHGGYGGGYGLGGISIGIGGFSGFGGYSGFGVNSGFGGYGSPYGYGGYGSSYGYGGSRLGYSNYYSARPSVYYSPNVVSRSSMVVVPSVNVPRSNSNVYTGPMSADGQPTGELRPGMVLPDGAIVVSVGSASK